MLKRSAAALAVLGLLVSPVHAADQIRIGFLSNLSGPFAVLGEEMQRGLDLALEHLGGKIGGLPTEIQRVDTKGKPDLAVEAVSRFVDRDRVQIVTGIILSNEFNAIGKQLNDKGVFVISGNSGTAMFSGKQCLPNIFVASFHNDTVGDAIGEYMSAQGIKSMVTLALNYQAGKDYVAGAKRAFKGKHISELYSDLDAVDFSSEIAQIRSANPEGLYIFLPARPGTAFLKQFAQAGLARKIRVFGVAVQADELNFSALGDVAVGLELGTYYTWSLDNPQNKKFVDSFSAKHGRLPTMFAAHQYDATMLIDSAVRAVGGKVEDQDAFRAALRKADFKSVKGRFSFNVNHYPIQNHYMVRVVKDEKGVLKHQMIATATVDQKDTHYTECDMKW